jgi:hypothetical protein
MRKPCASFLSVFRARLLTVPASIATAYAVRYARVLATVRAYDDVMAIRYAYAKNGDGVACGVSCAVCMSMRRY